MAAELSLGADQLRITSPVVTSMAVTTVFIKSGAALGVAESTAE